MTTMTNICEYSQVCRLDVCSLVRCDSECLNGTAEGAVCLLVCFSARISLLAHLSECISLLVCLDVEISLLVCLVYKSHCWSTSDQESHCWCASVQGFHCWCASVYKSHCWCDSEDCAQAQDCCSHIDRAHCCYGLLERVQDCCGQWGGSWGHFASLGCSALGSLEH